MKKLFVSIFLSTICTSNVCAQKMLYDDIVCPNGEKGNTAVTYWSKYNLSYCFKNYDCNLTSSQCQTAIQNAFNTWTQYSKFTFTQTNNLSQADIEISWEADSHSGCSPYSTYALAHASIGMYNRTPPAYVHFRKSISFTTTSSDNNLEAVALHEIGHVLGLPHDENHTTAVMWPEYSYKTSLTYYDLTALYSIYGFSITGPELVYTSGSYYINNLPSGLTVEWSLSDSYYSQNCFQQNYPSQNECTITRNSSHDMINATLTANIKYNSLTVYTLTRAVSAYPDFYGQYTSDNLSGTINYTHTFSVKPGFTTVVTSPNFYGATVTYNSSGTTPSYFFLEPTTWKLFFTMPTNNNGTPVIINVNDGCGNYYQLYAMPQNNYYLEIFNGDAEITVTLHKEGDDSSKSPALDMPWSVDICNTTSGVVMATRSSTDRSVSIPTSTWPKGVYAVKATVGKTELTEKVVVK